MLNVALYLNNASMLNIAVLDSMLNIAYIRCDKKYIYFVLLVMILCYVNIVTIKKCFYMYGFLAVN